MYVPLSRWGAALHQQKSPLPRPTDPRFPQGSFISLFGPKDLTSTTTRFVDIKLFSLLDCIDGIRRNEVELNQRKTKGSKGDRAQSLPLSARCQMSFHRQTSDVSRETQARNATHLHFALRTLNSGECLEKTHADQEAKRCDSTSRRAWCLAIRLDAIRLSLDTT